MADGGLVIYCVDPEGPSRVMLKSAFAADFEFEAFPSSGKCSTRMEERQPDLVLLDVSQASEEGFDYCRQLKDDPRTSSIPVILTSREESLEARLRGYDLGAEDFFVKPYAIAEIKRKVETVCRNLEKASAMRRQADDSELLTSLLLSSLDEYAVLIKFMRELTTCADDEAVASAFLNMLASFHLDGAVYVQKPDESFSLSPEGKNLARDLSVIQHVRTLERIFEFKQRCVFNFERLTVLVNNMPTFDLEACGRLRDYLAIAAESADGKLQALYLSRREMHMVDGIGQILADVRQTLSQFVEHHNSVRYQSSKMVSDMIRTVTESFAHLGLNESLEEEIESLIRETAYAIVGLYDNRENSTEILEALEKRLVAIAA